MHSHTIKDPPPNFLVPFTSLSLKFSPGFFHTHFLPSDPKSVDFGFIRPQHFLPILHSPMLVCQSKVHPLLPMFFGKEGLFLFHHSFHPNYFKAVTHSLSMERLVGDVRKSLGHIHSSISLSRTRADSKKTFLMRCVCKNSYITSKYGYYIIKLCILKLRMIEHTY